MDGSVTPAAADAALRGLLLELDRQGYDFVTPTPLTHRRVVSRRERARAGDLRDIVGWSLPFEPRDAPGFLLEALEVAGMLTPHEGSLKSAVRVSRLCGRLFLHSAFPTVQEDAVFLGPDSYRFADFILRALPPDQSGRIVDLGAGAGVGAIVAASIAPRAELTITDINPKALRLAEINAAHAGVTLSVLQTNGLEGVAPGIEVVVANPPYMAASHQAYRDGGAMHGGQLSVDWAEAALTRLKPGGRMLLYTGSAMLAGGRDEIRACLEGVADRHGSTLDYREIDPDVFGEELESAAYADVERIAVVTAVLRARE
ncbi:MAG: methyltransferase [Phenylobacterium sp.]